MRSLKVYVCSASLLTFAACDYVHQEERRDERSDKGYQVAMADYTAGHLDAAAKGFERVLKADPGNASARFQLACIDQDARRDYLEAFCHYREFLRFDPSSDKAKVATERMEMCRREIAKTWAAQLGLTDNAALARESEAARTELATYVQTAARLEKDLAAANARVAQLSRENAQFKRMISSVGEEESQGPIVLENIRDLLDDEGEDRLKVSPDARAIFEEEEAAEAAARPANETTQLSESASHYLPTATKPAATRLTDMGKRLTAEKKPDEAKRPKTYVVEEGDTLYGIAQRFYGRSSAWSRIREANKATISTDGRVRKGQRIVLP